MNLVFRKPFNSHIFMHKYFIFFFFKINEYFENIEKLLEYAGKSADIIDASYDGLTVKEKVDSCLAKDAPFAPPRTVKPQIETRPSDIEFEPSDDSPGLKILIKQFESAGELAGL